MEFNQKLKELRVQKGLTQEELADSLYVSRTAISKWESGRGYPNIDSLKAIAKFFSVTVDTLICASEAISIAENDTKRKDMQIRTLFFGVVDILAVLLVFLPLFGTKSGESVGICSLITLVGVRTSLKIAYYAVAVAEILTGIVTLALQCIESPAWLKLRPALSLTLGILAVLVFTVSSQPYAAVLSFVLLAVKVLLIIKRKG